MSYKCIYCDEEISGQEGKWGFAARSLRWIHYSCIEKLWSIYKSVNQSIDNNNHVRCTADGDYPEHRQEIIFQKGFEIRAGRYIIQIQLFGREEQIFVSDSNYAYYHDEELPVYWQPLTSLKTQYERERGGE